MKKIITAITSLVFVIAGVSPSLAIGGATALDATGDDKVVGIIMGGENWQRGCSGAAIAPRIVVTAAHCVYGVGPDGKWSWKNQVPVYGELKEDQKIWVSKPGVLIPLGGTKEKVKVIAQFPSKKYDRGYVENERGPGDKGRPLIYDFAILVLESPITDKTFKIASAEDVMSLKQSSGEVLSIGYGLQSYDEFINSSTKGSKPNPNKTVANVVRNTLYQRNSPSEIGSVDNMMIQIRYPIGTYSGGGDSGSPLWFKKNNEWVYLGASCCGLGIVAQTPLNSPDYKNEFLLNITGAEYHMAFAFPELFDEANKYLNKVSAPQAKEEVKKPVVSELKCKRNKQIVKLNSKRQKCPRGWELVK